ncbi:PTS glucose transporter subunit IIA [Bacillus coahuilensis m2-6]|uniref:PTS sugar transporter subunit IIA n=1 Tax=Bacillus coahuilensis TaxID=408580 RepID=UPI0001850C25|nr:PTS glucose transporter subunit IIA [Bacillus coahuilensis]KUP07972.1 PTS glucose transporter subunit IIA [Bacillus coahuilensis m2-6]
MFKKLFGKEEPVSPTVEVVAPITGKIVSLEEVPDPVFSQKMMGDGLAIEPTVGKVKSPIKGEVIQLFPTKHAVGLRALNGAEILIHIGLETVSMDGEGFESYVNQGDKVEVGQDLISFDINLIKEKAKSTLTPIIVTNSDEMNEIDQQLNGEVNGGTDVVLKITKQN